MSFRKPTAALAAVLTLCAVPALAQQYGHHHHHDFPAALAEFHDAMAPLWHARRDAQWPENTCAQAGELEKRAKAVSEAQAPQGMSAEDYAKGASVLAASVASLRTACAASGRPEVEARMTEVHNAFHRVSRH